MVVRVESVGETELTTPDKAEVAAGETTAGVGVNCCRPRIGFSDCARN